MAEADLPPDVQRLILENGDVRSVLRFAQASKQTDEVVAKVLRALIERDVPESYRAKFHFPFKGDWTAYKLQLAGFYKFVIERVARRMAEELVPFVTERFVRPSTWWRKEPWFVAVKLDGYSIVSFMHFERDGVRSNSVTCC
jgi:hypothetical protein